MAKRAKRQSANGVAMVFIGDGSSWVMGVPMRDMTTEEWGDLTEWQQEQVLKSGIYAPAQPADEEMNEYECVDR